PLCAAPPPRHPVPPPSPSTTLFRSRRLNRYRAERDQARARREKQKKAARGGGAGAKAAGGKQSAPVRTADPGRFSGALTIATVRSEEHTSELQSRFELVCRPLLDKK